MSPLGPIFFTFLCVIINIAIPSCSGDAAIMCEYKTQFEEKKWVLFGVLIYHVYHECHHEDAYFVFNKLSTQFSFICCTQGDTKYGACKFINCDDPPTNHPQRVILDKVENTQ